MSRPVIRLKEISSSKGRQGLLPVSDATIWRWSREENGKFPKPFKLSARVTVWDRAEVEEFIAQRAAEGQK